MRRAVASRMSNTSQLTTYRPCAGRCGTMNAYTVEVGPFTFVLEAGGFEPDPIAVGLVAYKDGHLCTACEVVVEAALAARRTAIAAEAFTRDSNG